MRRENGMWNVRQKVWTSKDRREVEKTGGRELSRGGMLAGWLAKGD